MKFAMVDKLPWISLWILPSCPGLGLKRYIQVAERGTKVKLNPEKTWVIQASKVSSIEGVMLCAYFRWNPVIVKRYLSLKAQALMAFQMCFKTDLRQCFFWGEGVQNVYFWFSFAFNYCPLFVTCSDYMLEKQDGEHLTWMTFRWHWHDKPSLAW